MDREFQNESATQDNAAAKNYRFDTARRASNRSGSAEVPVLFRLQNLQRNPDISLGSANSAPASFRSSSQTGVASAGKTSPSINREALPHSQRSQESKPKTPDSSAPTIDPIVPTTQDLSPAVASNKPWSTNVILLTIGVTVVFLLFKQNPSQPSLASSNPNLAESEKTNKPLVTSTSTTSSVSPIELQSSDGPKLISEDVEIPKSDKFLSTEPLVAPKLPAPIELVVEQPSSTISEPTPLVQQNANMDVTKIPSEPVDGASDIALNLPAHDLSVSTSEEFLSNPSTAHRSVMIPSDSVVSERPQANDVSSPLIASKPQGNESILYRQPTPTMVTNPHVALSPAAERLTQPIEANGNQREGSEGSPPQAQLVSTTSPELETAELFKLRERYLRANMESQQQAIAGNRQPMVGAPVQQWTNNNSQVVPPTWTVSGPTQPGPTYAPPSTAQQPVYQQQTVQAAPSGYGRVGLSGPTTASPQPPETTPSNQSYTPISGTFTPEGFVEDTNYSAQPQPQIPTSGGYQPLSPQFQSQPMNGN